MLGPPNWRRLLQPFSVHLLLSSLRRSAQKRTLPGSRVAVRCLAGDTKARGLGWCSFCSDRCHLRRNNAAPVERDLFPSIRDVLLADDNLVFDTRRGEARDG